MSSEFIFLVDPELMVYRRGQKQYECYFIGETEGHASYRLSSILFYIDSKVLLSPLQRLLIMLI